MIGALAVLIYAATIVGLLFKVKYERDSRGYFIGSVMFAAGSFSTIYTLITGEINVFMMVIGVAISYVIEKYDLTFERLIRR